jgi:hypothetical protein
VAAGASVDCVSCEHARDAAGLLQRSAEAMGGVGGTADVECCKTMIWGNRHNPLGVAYHIYIMGVL